MDWIGNNWIWIAFLVGTVAMNLFGHRGHSDRSGHGNDPDRDKPARADEKQIDYDHASAPQAGVASAGGPQLWHERVPPRPLS